MGKDHPGWVKDFRKDKICPGSTPSHRLHRWPGPGRNGVSDPGDPRGQSAVLVHDEPVRLADIADGKGTLVSPYIAVNANSGFAVTEYLGDDENFLISDGRRGSMPCSVCVTATSAALREWGFSCSSIT